MITTGLGAGAFVLLFVLLVDKEVRRALGKPGAKAWRIGTNWAIGCLLVLYGTVLLVRFLNLLGWRLAVLG